VKTKDYMKAMTTGRWPPKEDDMPMSPGAERALMQLSETLPALVKGIEGLTERLAPQNCKHSVEHPVLVGLSYDEWVAIIDAVKTLSHLIADQGPKEGQTREEVTQVSISLYRLAERIEARVKP
jgi:hypothetical protein